MSGTEGAEQIAVANLPPFNNFFLDVSIFIQSLAFLVILGAEILHIPESDRSDL